MPMFRRLAALAAVVACCLPATAQNPAYAWGNNSNGQLGDGTTLPHTSPLPVLLMSNGVTAVSAGNGFSLAVRDGTAFAWGLGTSGQLGTGSNTSSSAPLSVALPGSGAVTAVGAGSLHGVAVRNGAAYAWGAGGSGQLGNNGFSDSAVPVQVQGLASGVTAVSAGSFHTLAIQNGAAVAWGSGGSGRLGNGSVSNSAVPVPVTNLGSGVTAVAAGSSHSLAVQNGAAYAWGSATSGALGNGNAFVNQATPVAVTNLGSGVTAVSAGNAHSLAVQNGVVYAWGNNGSGQLGTGNNTQADVPVLVTGLPSNMVAVSAGNGFSFALSEDGRLFGWGSNAVGQLGIGSSGNARNTPAEVYAPAGFMWVGISGGSGTTSAHTLAYLAPVVPEPATVGLAAATGLGLAGLFRRRRSPAMTDRA